MDLTSSSSFANNTIDVEQARKCSQFLNSQFLSLDSLANIDRHLHRLNEQIQKDTKEVDEYSFKENELKTIIASQGSDILRHLTDLQKILSKVEEEYLQKDSKISNLSFTLDNLFENYETLIDLKNEFTYLTLKSTFEDYYKNVTIFMNELKESVSDSSYLGSISAYTNDRHQYFYLQIGKYKEIIKILQEKNVCTFLTNWMTQNLHTLQYELFSTLSELLKNVMEKINWPFGISGSLFSDLDTQSENTTNFKNLLIHFLILSHVSETRSVNDALDILLEPISLRLRYHFSGDKATNRMDKIDWYFDYSVDLLNQLNPFLSQDLNIISTEYLRPFLSDSDDLQLKELLIQKYISMMTKVFVTNHISSLTASNRSIKWVLFDYIKEAMTFDKFFLLEEFGYESDRGSFVYLVQTLPKLMDAWFQMELERVHKFVQEEINTQASWIIQSFDSFDEGEEAQPPLKNEEKNLDVTNSKTTLLSFVSFELFVGMIDELEMTYQYIPDPNLRISLYRSVIEPAFESFFTILQDKFDEAEEQSDFIFYGHALRSLIYLRDVIENWLTSPFFSSIKEEDSDTSEKLSNSPSLLEKQIVSSDALIESIISKICENITNDLSIAFDNYRMINFVIADILVSKHTRVIANNSIVQFMKYLKSVLQLIQEHIPSQYHATIQDKILDFFENLLFKDIILSKHFNEIGVRQLQLDIDYIKLIIADYWDERIDFVKWHESLTLLHLGDESLTADGSGENYGTAMSDKKQNIQHFQMGTVPARIKKVLATIDEELPFHAIALLKSLGVSHLTMADCRKILILRSTLF